MRSIFIKSRLATTVRILDRIIALICVVFWGMIAFNLVGIYVQRKFTYPLRYKDLIMEIADYYQLDRILIFSIIKVESGFNKNAVSDAGAVGLMQLTPKTGEYVAKMLKLEEYDLYNPKTNVKLGCFYFKYLLNKFETVDTAICAYNAGEGNISLWLNDLDYSNNGKTLNNIPFSETQDYLQKIHKSYKKYRELYGNILDKI